MNRRLGKIRIDQHYIQEFLQTGAHHLIWKAIARDLIMLKTEDDFITGKMIAVVWHHELPIVEKGQMIPEYSVTYAEVRDPESGRLVDYKVKLVEDPLYKG